MPYPSAHLVDRGIDEYKEGMENLLFDLDLMYMLRCLRMKEDWGQIRRATQKRKEEYEGQRLTETHILVLTDDQPVKASFSMTILSHSSAFLFF